MRLGKFIKGDVVVVPLPFSDLARAKRRPALVVAELVGHLKLEKTNEVIERIVEDVRKERGSRTIRTPAFDKRQRNQTESAKRDFGL